MCLHLILGPYPRAILFNNFSYFSFLVIVNIIVNYIYIYIYAFIYFINFRPSTYEVGLHCKKMPKLLAFSRDVF